MRENFYVVVIIPGESIRPADPVVFDRIRIGFHRNPTFFIKNRSDRTEFLSNSLQSDSDPDFVGIRGNPMKSGSDLVEFQSCSVEFRQNSGRNPTEENPTKTLSDPIEIFSIRRDPIPLSHMGCLHSSIYLNFFLSFFSFFMFNIFFLSGFIFLLYFSYLCVNNYLYKHIYICARPLGIGLFSHNELIIVKGYDGLFKVNVKRGYRNWNRSNI